ncbi:MAG: hypothetical protein V4565_06010 [Bacteroidota bacterium]
MKQSVLFLLLLVFVSCQDDPHFLGEFETINTDDAVKGMINNMAADIKVQGLKAKSNYMAADFHEFWILPGMDKTMSKNEVALLFGLWDKKNKVIDFKIDNLHVYPITLLRVVYHFNSELTYKDSLNTTHKMKQIESGVASKFNLESKWMFLNGQISTINNN